MIPVLYGYCQNLILNCQSKEILPNENFHCQKTLKDIRFDLFGSFNASWQLDGEWQNDKVELRSEYIRKY